MIFNRLCRLKQMVTSDYSKLGSRFRHDYVTSDSKMYTRFLHPTSLSENLKEIPEYPPIIDTSDKGQDRYFRGLWYDSVKSLPSVEEKLYELAIQQKLEHKIHTLSVAPPMYNGVYFNNYITRTHLIQNLPKQFTHMDVDKELTEIKDVLCETLFDHYCNIWKERKFKYIYEYLSAKNAGSELVKSLVLQCYKKLALRNDYVFNSTVSHNMC